MDIDYKDILEEAYKEQFEPKKFNGSAPPVGFVHFVGFHDVAKAAVDAKWHDTRMRYEFAGPGMPQDLFEQYWKEYQETESVMAPADLTRLIYRKDMENHEAFLNFLKNDDVMIGPVSKKYPVEFFMEHYKEIDWKKA